jgi:hypothetical protein
MKGRIQWCSLYAFFGCSMREHLIEMLGLIIIGTNGLLEGLFP